MDGTVLLGATVAVLAVAALVGSATLLGTARGAARATATAGPPRAGRLALVCTLLATLLLGLAGAWTAAALLRPGSPARWVGAVVAGVLLLAAGLAVSSRVAAGTERARERRSPRPLHTSALAPDRSARGPAEPTPGPARDRPGPPPTDRSVLAPRGLPPTPPGPPTDAATPGALVPGALVPGALVPGALVPGALVPGAPDPVIDERALYDHLRPGWIYQDADGDWFMGVGGHRAADGERPPAVSAALLRLPGFTLSTPAAPVYPLRVMGAAELAVVPMDDEVGDG